MEQRDVPIGRGSARFSLGIVIALPPALSGRIGRLRSSFGDPFADHEAPHITLISGAASGAWDEAHRHVARVAAQTDAFTIRLRGTASFRPASEVVYLKVAQGEGACRNLHARLCDGPLEHQVAFEYHPHLTVAHDAPPDGMERALHELADFDAEFVVERIGLFSTDDDGQWTLSEELTLGTNGREN
ncbi:2'-5' RNA ligase family protein [Zhihengliuella salsuginis]|nr:2'-5' RNA ligase family protein [Zhihengliuella salsuginis]